METRRNAFAPRLRKLSDDDVRAIRADERDLWTIADVFGVSHAHVRAIRMRTRKASVPDQVPDQVHAVVPTASYAKAIAWRELCAARRRKRLGLA
jgi:hypothetical protein